MSTASMETVAGIFERDVDPHFTILGVRFHAVQISDVIRRIESWVLENRCSNYICVSNVHSVIEARRDATFKSVLNAAALCVPDGMPIVWLGRHFGFPLRRRVYGPDLLLEFCGSTASRGYKHFFYGGAPGVPEALMNRFKNRFPELQIVGVYSPPFRDLSDDEDAAAVELINQASPDILWVGLGCPKQEIWMAEHCHKLNAHAIVGIGQAFAIHAGTLRQAPSWMREHGFEWLFRLLSEPARLWKRYLVYNTKFLLFIILQLLGFEDFQ